MTTLSPAAPNAFCDEDFLDGGFGFRQGRADQHALAGGEAVGFDHIR